MAMWRALLVALSLAASPASATESAFLFDNAERPLIVPIKVQVGLLGFELEGGTPLKAEELAAALRSALPFERPQSLTTGPLGVEYALEYEVKHLNERHLQTLERALGENMETVAARRSVGGDTARPVYDVEAKRVQPYLDEAYTEEFGGAARPEGVDGLPYAVLIVNPRKASITPAAAKSLHHAAPSAVEAGAFDYRYRYDDSHCSATWVSAERYVVIDVAAGACEFGPVRAAELGGGLGSAAVADASMPTIRDAALDLPHEIALLHDAEALSKVNDLVVSAVRHVFVPGVRHSVYDRSEKILLALVVLCNHKEFDPLTPGHKHSLDTGAIESAAKALALPGQVVTMISGMHNIHEHEQLAVGVHRALRRGSGSVEYFEEHTGYDSQPYIESAALFERLETSGDTLIATLVDLAKPELHDAFFHEEAEEDAASLSLEEEIAVSEQHGQSSAVLVSVREPPRHLAGNASAEPKRKPGPRVSSSKPGTRVVPVFVFSMLGVDDGTLLDGTELAVGSPGMVVALQGDSDVRLHFQSDGKTVVLSTRNPTRHIIGALASTMSNLLPPTQRHSATQGKLVESYLWGVGAHPFGPFSNSAVLSRLYGDAAMRNAVLCSVSSCLQTTHAAIAQIVSFSAEFDFDPHGEHTQAYDRTTLKSARLNGKVVRQEGVLSFLHSPAAHLQQLAVLESLPRKLIAELRQGLSSLETAFTEVSELLFAMKHRQALEKLGAIETEALAFQRRTASLVYESRLKLACCSTRQTAPGDAQRETGNSRIAAFAFCAVVVVAVLGALLSKVGVGRRRSKASYMD